jgi:hypothetical protein
MNASPPYGTLVKSTLTPVAPIVNDCCLDSVSEFLKVHTLHKDFSGSSEGGGKTPFPSQTTHADPTIGSDSQGDGLFHSHNGATIHRDGFVF